jgi:hypothetical protein
MEVSETKSVDNTSISSQSDKNTSNIKINIDNKLNNKHKMKVNYETDQTDQTDQADQKENTTESTESIESAMSKVNYII